MPIVVDCSVAAAWALVDERTDWTSGALRAVAAEGGFVPAIFWFEIRNILVVNERRGRISTDQTARFLADLAPLVEVGPPPVETRLLDLARVTGLTVYDASYLELAQRLGFALCSLDGQLIEAAAKIGVALWQPES
jgi:predicted nucleic acid-binding protein